MYIEKKGRKEESRKGHGRLWSGDVVGWASLSLFTTRILLYPLHSQRHRLCVQSAFEVMRKGLNPRSKILHS